MFGPDSWDAEQSQKTIGGAPPPTFTYYEQFSASAERQNHNSSRDYETVLALASVIFFMF